MRPWLRRIGDWARAEPLAAGVLVASFLVGLALRLHLAVTDQGIYWPDEVYQSLEPAHRLVWGYGLVAWEFREGARNWALPALVAALLKLCALVGLDRPEQYTVVVKATFGLLGSVCGLGTYRLARAYGASPRSAAAGAAALALAGMGIYFAPRAMSESASAPAVVFGLALGLVPSPRRWQVVAGASLLGLAVLLRLQTGIFALGLLAVLMARRRFRDAGLALGVLGAWALLFGLLDHWTWAGVPGARFGGWFHSAIKYLEFNVQKDGAKAWGTSGADYYFVYGLRSLGALAVVLAGLALCAARRAGGLLALLAVFLLLHVATGHKELRFVYPMLPLWCAAAAVGLEALPPKPSAWLGLPTLVVTACLSALAYPRLVWGDVGQYLNMAGQTAFDRGGGINRLLMKAGRQGDLCGLRIDAEHLAWTGGATYLHRRVPLYHLGRPPPESGLFNYVIAFGPASAPGVVATDERVPNLVLARVAPTCAADPGYDWALP